GTIAILALTAREVVKRLTPEQAIFLITCTAITIVLGTAAVHEYWGLNRYLLLCPMTFLGCGIMLRRHPAVFVGWLALCAMIYWHIELCSYISHGNLNICPCLGRYEFSMPFQS